jgi:hypothetical protein
METKEELLRGDFENHLYETSKGDALQDFIDKALEMTISVEHEVPFHMEGPDVYNSDPKVARVIDQIITLGRWFVYNIDVVGKYRLYEESFAYNFEKEAFNILHDELGYYIEDDNDTK